MTAESRLPAAQRGQRMRRAAEVGLADPGRFAACRFEEPGQAIIAVGFAGLASYRDKITGMLA